MLPTRDILRYVACASSVAEVVALVADYLVGIPTDSLPAERRVHTAEDVAALAADVAGMRAKHGAQCDTVLGEIELVLLRASARISEILDRTGTRRAFRGRLHLQPPRIGDKRMS